MGREQTTKEVLADRDAWKKLGRPMGWVLFGWTFRDSATYYTTDPKVDPRSHLLHVTWAEMQSIARAISRAAKHSK